MFLHHTGILRQAVQDLDPCSSLKRLAISTAAMAASNPEKLEMLEKQRSERAE